MMPTSPAPITMSRPIGVASALAFSSSVAGRKYSLMSVLEVAPAITRYNPMTTKGKQRMYALRIIFAHPVGLSFGAGGAPFPRVSRFDSARSNDTTSDLHLGVTWRVSRAALCAARGWPILCGSKGWVRRLARMLGISNASALGEGRTKAVRIDGLGWAQFSEPKSPTLCCAKDGPPSRQRLRHPPYRIRPDHIVWRGRRPHNPAHSSTQEHATDQEQAGTDGQAHTTLYLLP
jgi:hypothetical protein